MSDVSDDRMTAAEVFVRSLFRDDGSRAEDLCVLALERALIRDGALFLMHDDETHTCSDPVAATHLVDPPLASVPDDNEVGYDCGHVRDWIVQAVLNGSGWLDRTDREGRPLKLMKIGSLDRAVREADKEMLRFASSAASTMLQSGDEVIEMDLGEDWSVVRLASETSLDLESARMQHCIGQGAYDDKLSTGSSLFFSLRDPAGKPHVTLEVDPFTRTLVQFQGKQNAAPLRVYADRVRPFVAARCVVPTDGPIWSTRIVTDRHGANLHLDDLPDVVELDGDIDLTDFTGRLPKELRVSGTVCLPRDNPDGIVDCEVHAGRNLLVGGGNARVFSRPLHVEGRLTLNDIPVESLHPGSRVGQEIVLRKLPNMRTLPHGLAGGDAAVLRGGFTVENTGLVDLDGVVETVGSLTLVDSPIARLPADLVVEGRTRIAGCPIRALPGTAKFGGDVHLDGDHLEHVGVNVFSALHIHVSDGMAHAAFRPHLSMDAGIRVKDQLDLRSVSMPAGLPSSLAVRMLTIRGGRFGRGLGAVLVDDFAHLVGCDMDELPADFDCGGNLKIANCRMSSIGARFRVSGVLEIEGTDIRSIGKDATIGTRILGSLPSLETIGPGFSIGVLDPDTLSDAAVLPAGMRVRSVRDPERFRGRLPNGLHVKGDLDLTSFQLEEIPDGLVVDGDLILPVSEPSFG